MFVLNIWARFQVTITTQINKSVVYFIVKRNVKFGCSDKSPCTNIDVKSGFGDKTHTVARSLYGRTVYNYIPGKELSVLLSIHVVFQLVFLLRVTVSRFVSQVKCAIRLYQLLIIVISHYLSVLQAISYHNARKNKNIANDCVIPRHCKHFHSPKVSNRFIFSVSTMSRAAKRLGAWNKIYVLIRHFITLISYYKLTINHFPL